MKYKLVAMDLDGTLLGLDKKISQETVDLIQEKAASGVVFTIATGRFYHSALPYARQLGLDVPIITYNGAMIKASLSEQVYHHLTLDLELARQAIGLIQPHEGMRFLFYDDVIATDAGEAAVPYEFALKVNFRYETDLLATANREPTMVVFRVPEANTPELTARLTGHLGDRVHITNSLPFFIEINHPEADKGRALAKLGKTLGIRREEIIAIGDSYNDLEMVEYAGLGAFVGNAPEVLKAKGDYAADGHREEGVREILSKFL
ncbi:MAG: Cof-type HAD-IIB family hydrolase [Clostridia bacterium]|nr:Cof-type HAD-IIB family hydrolase [Clostridia bacterium]